MTEEVLDRSGRGKHHPHLHKYYYTTFSHEFLKSRLRTRGHPGSPEVGGSFSPMRIKIICGQLDSTDLEVVGGGFDDSMRRFEKQDAWPRPPRYFFEGTIFNGVLYGRY